ncbi:MAG: hypothetical protein IKI64_10580 [Clostridia bacterium]|nr:hypothetical protein [Clostridia bacterium]
MPAENDALFAHDACLTANDARLRRMMCACGALRLPANEIRLKPGEIFFKGEIRFAGEIAFGD